ncbi:suppressor of fused domain protein [Kitasatospora sp. SolWspMP-SS2h]|uniref:suppressor of fused domain protein n=1 Tax=Kitasatospora sp. SolWspMP-SS2h TaxID=1305729 RepID=UPI000DBA7E07|nr:suppressor of fused domain protein [Kitasatospora sp. SolWspMP-SS2h]
MNGEDECVAALERHVRKFWDGHIVEPAPWGAGPIHERVPKFMVYRIFPERAGEAWVYVTVGSSIGDKSSNGVEFFIMSPVALECHSETLAMVSHYNSYEAHRLTVGSVISIGRPWMPGSRMEHLLVSLPYPYGPKLEWSPPEAGSARFLWLLPIHKREADFIRHGSLDEFEEILDSKAVNVLDPDRDPVL